MAGPFAERLRRWQQELQAAGVQAALLTAGINFYYLSGFYVPHAGERLTALLVPAAGEPVLIVPALEREAARASWVTDVRAWRDGEDPYVVLAAAARDRGVTGGVWGLEGDRATVNLQARLQSVGALAGWRDIGPSLAAMRVIKSAAEAELMRRACRFLEPALDRVRRGLRPGVSEREIVAWLSEEMEAAGSEGHAFPAIALTGAKSALPHGVPGRETVADGDLVVIDFGGICEGYASDITRTFLVGNVSAQAQEIYDVVLAANEAGIAAARPGVPAEDVDAAARRVIEEAGYGQYFVHRTGHGIGLDVHEAPWITAGNREPLRPGMAHSVEPGIYVPGVGGVRIEDLVLITDDGCEVLTRWPKERAAVTVGG